MVVRYNYVYQSPAREVAFTHPPVEVALGRLDRFRGGDLDDRLLKNNFPRRRTALNGETVRVKFRIYPDGRVEETVSGIRGSDCTKVTEELNEKLGKVTQTKPTEEMFQEKVDVKTEVFDQNFSEW